MPAAFIQPNFEFVEEWAKRHNIEVNGDYKKMIAKGKHYNLVVTAIAREMITYIWAIAKEVVLKPVNTKLRLARVPA